MSLKKPELIEATVGTLRHALIEEIILVTLAHVIFFYALPQHLDRDASPATSRAVLLPLDALRERDFERYVTRRNCDCYWSSCRRRHCGHGSLRSPKPREKILCATRSGEEVILSDMSWWDAYDRVRLH
jgi:hypothetical protein